ncbi:MAG TPA: hypothetical protein VLU25_19930 [Acidobacteriota bacterium]|nr:hypothetical protein [Acidobacteriota bacterium]
MKVCPFCSQTMRDAAKQCPRCGRSQIFNEDDRPALGWAGCLLLIATTAFSVTALALLLGVFLGWVPGALGSNWGGTLALLVLLAVAGHWLRRYLERSQEEDESAVGQARDDEPGGPPAS